MMMIIIGLDEGSVKKWLKRRRKQDRFDGNTGPCQATNFKTCLLSSGRSACYLVIPPSKNLTGAQMNFVRADYNEGGLKRYMPNKMPEKYEQAGEDMNHGELDPCSSR